VISFVFSLDIAETSSAAARALPAKRPAPQRGVVLCVLFNRAGSVCLQPARALLQLRREYPAFKALGKILGARLIRPAAGHDSLFGVKMDRVFAESVQVAEEGILPTGKGEESHRSGHAHVDPHPSRVHILGELARGPA